MDKGKLAKLSMVAEFWFLLLLCFLLHASMHLSTRSDRLGLRKTFPVQDLGAPVSPTPLPGRDDAHPSLHIPQHNLGLQEGGAGRVDQPSKKSLGTSFQAQKLDESLSDNRLAPSSQKSFCLS